MTIKDIAQTLNVSPSAVSRAFKDNLNINREAHSLVHTYTHEYNYKPSVPAVNLHSSRSNTIGVIIPQLMYHFFSCVLSDIEVVAAEASYNIIVAQSNESYEQEVKTAQSLLAARICGVIASLTKNMEQYNHYQELLDNNVPVVFYDRIYTGLKAERVVVDDYAGSFTVVEYMTQTGCERTFFYGIDLHLEITKNRHNRYPDAVKKYRIPVNDSMIKLCDNHKRAIAIAPDLLESDNRPDGFSAINGETATGILYACKLVGLEVPDGVLICDFTDEVIAQSTDPKLTTMKQCGEEVRKNAFSILTDKLGGDEEKNTNRIVRTNLVVRGTTK